MISLVFKHAGMNIKISIPLHHASAHISNFPKGDSLAEKKHKTVYIFSHYKARATTIMIWQKELASSHSEVYFWQTCPNVE